MYVLEGFVFSMQLLTQVLSSRSSSNHNELQRAEIILCTDCILREEHEYRWRDGNESDLKYCHTDYLEKLLIKIVYMLAEQMKIL